MAIWEITLTQDERTLRWQASARIFLFGGRSSSLHGEWGDTTEEAIEGVKARIRELIPGTLVPIQWDDEDD